MQRKAARGEAEGTAANALLWINKAPAGPLTGALAHGHLSLHRGGGQSCQQGLLLPQGIGVALLRQAAALQQAHHALGRGLYDLLHLFIAQARCRHEGLSAIGGDINPIQHQHVHVGVEI